MLDKKKFSEWYDKNYKILLFISLGFFITSFIYLGYFYQQNNDFVYKDVSLKGGTSLTINGNIDAESLEKYLKDYFNDVSFRKLSEMTTGELLAVTIETSAEPEELTEKVEEFGIMLDNNNSSVEFTGSSLSKGFYKQLLIAISISFILLSMVIFVLFKSFVPSITIVFVALVDIAVPLSIINMFKFPISSAGVAAFLMLIGYCVDTNILLTTRALKKKEGTLNSRLFGAFKTGMMMTITSLSALIPAFFIITGLPDSFRQILLILFLGLMADIVATWIFNASVIKWYSEKKK